MNTQTAQLVEQAIVRVRTSLLDQQPAAVIGIEADAPLWLTDLSYWRQPYDFEREGGQLGAEQRTERVVFAVPLITLTLDDGAMVFRPADGTVADDEVQQVWIVSIDLNDGFDVHRCIYRTAVDGLLQFDDIQTYNGTVRLDEGAPGWQLLQSVINP